MALSRLRLRLTAGFAAAFAGGIVLLQLSLFLYLERLGDQRLSSVLDVEAAEVLAAIQSEVAQGSPTAEAVVAELEERTGRVTAIVVTDAAGVRLAARGPRALIDRIPPSAMLPEGAPTDFPLDDEGDLRVLLRPARIGGQAVRVYVAASTARLREDNEALALWLVGSAPVVLLLSLAGGYGISRLTLRPLDRLADAVGRIAPDLALRLPVRTPPDEIDRLATQFNELLDRLQDARRQNTRFVREAAHQLRTPLTLVLGESELALDPPTGPEDPAGALRRIRAAALQMSHRVKDLFLLEEAAAGTRIPLTERVELDGTVLEAVDLFRARAHGLGRRLELGRLEGVEVLGDPILLREAVLELLENACRHGSTEAPIRVEVVREGHRGVMTVENVGPGLPAAWGADGRTSRPESRRGLGLSILRWIATEHGGDLEYSRVGTRTQMALSVPILPSAPPPSQEQ